MSKKIFYIYNPKTLTYERVYPSLRQRIIVVLRHLFVGSILSIGVIVAFYFLVRFAQRRASENGKRANADTI